MAITRISTTSDGQQADGGSSLDSLYRYDAGALGPNAFSSDGSEIVFVSNAENITGDGSSKLVLKNLTTGLDTVVAQADTAAFTPDGHSLVYTAFDNGGEQIYEQTGGKTVLVSSAGDGTEGDGISSVDAVSTNGGRVAFESTSSNLVANQNTGVTSFVKDITTGKIVQLGDGDGNGNASTASSVDFSFASDLSEAVYTNEANDQATGPAPEVYAENLTDGSKTLVSGTGGTAGNMGGYGGILVSGGRQVVFNTLSTDLVAGAPSGGIFMKTLSNGALSAVVANSIAKTGNVTSGTAYEAAAASPDGTHLAYYSSTGTVTKNADGSDSGTFTSSQIKVVNLVTGAVANVSPSSNYTFTDGPPAEAGSPYESPFGNSGTSLTGSINGTVYGEPVYSPDGSKIAFAQETYSNFTHDETKSPSVDSGTETTQIFVYNVNTGATTAITDPATYNFATKSGNFYTNFQFSPNSRDAAVDFYTAGQSAQGTQTTTSQTIVTNLATGSQTVVPTDSSGVLFAPDGNSVAFSSGDATLVPNDTNNAPDVFVEPLLQCFVTGTAIRTVRGDTPVEALRIGDLAVTQSGDVRPIVWVGQRVVECAARAVPSESWPVRIRAGAFGGDLPERDLLLSPGHPVLVGDGAGAVLVPIMCLINGTSIARLPVETVTYWHVELDAHDILLAEGLPAESFLDLGSRAWFENSAEDALANPDLVAAGRGGRCRPVATDGAQVEAERRRLDAVFAMRLEMPCAWPTGDLLAGSY